MPPEGTKGGRAVVGISAGASVRCVGFRAGGDKEEADRPGEVVRMVLHTYAVRYLSSGARKELHCIEALVPVTTKEI